LPAYMETSHARKSDEQASENGQKGGEGPDHTSGRVRPRGDRARPRQQARDAFVESGHRNRSHEGPARHRRASAVQEESDFGRDAQGYRARQSAGQGREGSGSVRDPSARRHQGFAPRRQEGPILHGLVAAGAIAGGKTLESGAFGGRTEGTSDPVERAFALALMKEERHV